MEASNEYKSGFEAAKQLIRDAVGKVRYQSGHQPDMYSEWVYTDRRSYDVLRDCLDAVDSVKIG
jgi:hypothetical protein